MTTLDEISAALQSLPDTLAALLGPIDDGVLRTRPEPGEWCPLEVVGHLIACDAGAFRDRISTIIAGDGPIPPFDPWAAIEARDFAAEPLDRLLDELRLERAASAAFLADLDEAELARTGVLTGHEQPFAANDFVHEWPFHDQDHLQQILDCLKGRWLPAMSEPMRTALTATGSDAGAA